MSSLTLAIATAFHSSFLTNYFGIIILGVVAMYNLCLVRLCLRTCKIGAIFSHRFENYVISLWPVFIILHKLVFFCRGFIIIIIYDVHLWLFTYLCTWDKGSVLKINPGKWNMKSTKRCLLIFFLNIHTSEGN